MHKNMRKIYARGLTPNEHNKLIVLPDGTTGFLRSVEHLDGTSILHMVVAVDVKRDAEVVVYD